MSDGKRDIKTGIALGIILIALVIALIFASAHAASSPFTTRLPGVKPGNVAIYDDWFGQSHYTIRFDITKLNGTIVTYNVNSTTDDGRNFFSAVQLTDVAGFGSHFPGFIIATNMNNGVEVYPGDSRVLTLSLFGHVVLGQWRSTLYSDGSDKTLTLHTEWDRATGLLISFLFIFNGDGESIQLKYTNIWSPNIFWVGVEDGLIVGRAIVPIMFVAGISYLLSFLVIGFIDWMRIRRLKRKISSGMGGMLWFQVKIMVVAILIVMVIISVFFIVLRFLLR